jgi:1-acyl-sn-glycerol-3-phosphate acyltransferase
MSETVFSPPKPAVEALRPSRWSLIWLKLFAKIANLIGPLLLKKYLTDIEVEGAEHLKGGPKLVLMNHTNALDPIILSAFSPSPISMLVTEPFMANRLAAKFVSWVGHIPKRKLLTDTKSIQAMKKWTELGGNVGLFPEGQYSWDGEASAVQPGLAQLVRYLNVPVVFVRLINGDRVWPMWANTPRKTKIKLEIDSPIIFDQQTNIEKIVAQKIMVETPTDKAWEASGEQMASGLAKFFRYCPQCFKEDSLVEFGNEIECKSCTSRWAIDGERKLIALAHTSIQGPFADIWKQYKQDLLGVWKGQQSLLSLHKVQVMDASRPQWKAIDEGQLKLSDEKITIGEWELQLEHLLGLTLDWGHLILLRTRRQRLAIRMENDSRAIWEYAFNQKLNQRANNVQSKTDH